MAEIWLRYGKDMENGKSVANWWQNTGIDMYGIFVYKSKKAAELVDGS